jgi:hypothetical protein
MSSPGRKGNTTVYALIHELHSTITKSIDTSLSWDQLNSPPVNYTLVRPIVERLCPSSHTSNENKKSGLETGDRLRVPGLEDGGETGLSKKKEERGEGLGMILYALMANRYVPILTHRTSARTGEERS